MSQKLTFQSWNKFDCLLQPLKGKEDEKLGEHSLIVQWFLSHDAKLADI
jgi:hypothetical protein